MDWLETLKKADKLNFDVDNVRMRGARFNDLTKSDLKELTGNTKAVIIIFNAKEKQVSGTFFAWLLCFILGIPSTSQRSKLAHSQLHRRQQ